MGVRNFVRNRKQVQADRAESGSHKKLVDALSKTNNKNYSSSFDKHADEALSIVNSQSNGGVYDQEKDM